MNRALISVKVASLKVWKSIVTLILLAVWLPAVAVCLAEKSGMIVDGCCPVEKAASDKNPACEQGCKLMQGDGLKVQGFKVLAPAVLMAIRQELCETQARSCISPDCVEISASESLRLPQFVLSTSLPIRGPSFAS